MLQDQGDVQVAGARSRTLQTLPLRVEEGAEAVAVDAKSFVPTTATDKLQYYLRDRTKYLHMQNEIPEQVTRDLSLVSNYYVSISDPQDMAFINPGQSTLNRVCCNVYVGLLNLFLQSALLVPTFLFLIFSAVRTKSSPTFLLVYTILIDLGSWCGWARASCWCRCTSRTQRASSLPYCSSCTGC